MFSSISDTGDSGEKIRVLQSVCNRSILWSADTVFGDCVSLSVRGLNYTFKP